MRRPTGKLNLRKRVAAAVVALALLAGAAGPVVSSMPDVDTGAEVSAAYKIEFGGNVYRYGGSWS